MVQTRSGMDTALTRKQLLARLKAIIAVHDSLDYKGQTDNAIQAIKIGYQLTRLLPNAIIFMDTFQHKLIEFSHRYEVRKNPAYQRIARQILDHEVFQVLLE